MLFFVGSKELVDTKELHHTGSRALASPDFFCIKRAKFQHGTFQCLTLLHNGIGTGNHCHDLVDSLIAGNRRHPLWVNTKLYLWTSGRHCHAGYYQLGTVRTHSLEHVIDHLKLIARIIVKRTEEEDVTKGGIIIPDSAKEKPIQGKILAVGTGKVMEDGSKLPLDVKKGDTVLFSRYAGSEVKIEGEDLLIMREDDVLAVIEK